VYAPSGWWKPRDLLQVHTSSVSQRDADLIGTGNSRTVPVLRYQVSTHMQNKNKNKNFPFTTILSFPSSVLIGLTLPNNNKAIASVLPLRLTLYSCNRIDCFSYFLPDGNISSSFLFSLQTGMINDDETGTAVVRRSRS
jgi:hypothetical protein